GSTRSITPTVSIGSGSDPAGRMRSVAARTAPCRCATVGLRASASATSHCRPESPATGAESCACAGPALAITNALAARISCRNCIPLLANRFPAERAGARAARGGASGHTTLGRGQAWGGGGSGACGSAGARVETPKPTMWDSRAEVETVPPSVTTAGAVIAQNAELAHGVAWVIAPTAGPERWEAICCSQLAGAARWTWSHNNGRPTGNIWPLNSSVATNLTSESFMSALEYSMTRYG